MFHMVPPDIMQYCALAPDYQFKIQFSKSLAETVNEFFDYHVCKFCKSDDLVIVCGLVGIAARCKECTSEYYIEYDP